MSISFVRVAGKSAQPAAAVQRRWTRVVRGSFGLICILLAACDDSGFDHEGATTGVTIGGQVSGLSGTGLQLQDNGGRHPFLWR